MRKLIWLAAVISIMFVVASCGGTTEEATTSAKPPAARPPTSPATLPPATSAATAAERPSPAPALSVGANVGELAPDFQLPAASGADSALASYRGDKNVVVVFYRAFW